MHVSTLMGSTIRAVPLQAMLKRTCSSATANHNRFAFSFTSWFKSEALGMADYEMLSRASAFAVTAKAHPSRRLHFFTTLHVPAPFLFPRWYPASQYPWLQGVRPDDVRSTLELRDVCQTRIARARCAATRSAHCACGAALARTLLCACVCRQTLPPCCIALTSASGCTAWTTGACQRATTGTGPDCCLRPRAQRYCIVPCGG